MSDALLIGLKVVGVLAAFLTLPLLVGQLEHKAMAHFDMPLADSELGFGYLTEYDGLRFALLLLAEYVGIVVVCALTIVLFLGGWRGPFLSEELGPLWTILKIFALSFVVIWARVAYPRLREDQLQRLAWQGLVPIALAQRVLTGVVVTVRS